MKNQLLLYSIYIPSSFIEGTHNDYCLITYLSSHNETGDFAVIVGLTSPIFL
jgi:hypothetical protein